MPTTPLSLKVPGKLMIAGEFAVLEAYQNLVVMAVDRFVYVSLTQQDENRLSLLNFDLANLEWTYNEKKVNIKTADKRVKFVEDAMSVVYTYLKEMNVSLANFHLEIRSELDDESGRKYGLGSSAAVVTSVVAAILKKYLPKEPSAKLIFKLAAISHVKTQGSGSGADVAASSYGGFLQYASFQAEWLQYEYEKADTIRELVEKDWQYLSLKPIKLPVNAYMCIGWTGTPASTGKLIDKIKRLKTENNTLYEQFLEESNRAVSTFIKGVTEEDAALIVEGTKRNRRALATVGKHANADIETPMLQKLCDLAELHGGAGKPSGAGGGDCGIAFLPSKEQAQQLMKAWEEAGIKPLDIQLSKMGATEI
ncbi:phosphomevalonate kinase [Virgibacillus subterraneus]|uniref:phosphomevalonate kinase n=1 Tax=Virgibacillus subterraneus TaxID=621109 RepID=A0A1H9I6B8_9BACI|nr:phosphomevalonate kinase [Virgibacillus subterraneus]SEQ70113.1 phosphomevalonate kinase [Virgibacillus subterraneus]